MLSLAPPAGAMAPPPLPAHRPILGKRDSSCLDTEDESNLSVSTKKLKVAFDPKVDVRILEDTTEKGFELVKEEVHIAIQQHVASKDAKDDARYVKLLDLLDQDLSSSDALSGAMLKKYLLAIDTHAGALGGCGRLAMAAIGISWIGRDEAFVGLYTKFLCDLASAHAKFVAPIMDKLVSYFVKLPASLGRLANEVPISRANMFMRLHSVIKIVLRQVPSASSALMKAVRLLFPNDLDTNRCNMQYQRNLLRLSEYAPELRYEIITAIVQRLVAIDVQIQQDIEDLEEEVEERILQKRSSGTGAAENEESDDSDAESISESEDTVTDEELRLRELRLQVAKLDDTLDLLFNYYTPLIDDGSPPETNDAYHQLLSQFRSFILPSRSRHAQFLLFHFSQKSTAHSELFVEQCLQQAFQERSASNIRLTALAYLSSFVARGAHLSRTTVQNAVEHLCTSLESMRRKYEPSSRGPDRRSYGLYYAVAQALLYIFCFRWRDLAVGSSTPESDTDGFNEDDTIAEGRDLAWCPGLKETMNKNIYCRLNPLKICAQAIVSEFSKLAFHLRFMFVFSLLETNKRIRLGQSFSYYGSNPMADIGRRETTWDRKTGEIHHQLEAYFPFDPYHLPKSKHYIADDYNEWKLPIGMQSFDEGHSAAEDEDDSNDESLPDDRAGYPEADDFSVSSSDGVPVV